MRLSAREKRADKRVPVQITAHCRIGNRFMKQPVGDLSRGGLYLKAGETVSGQEGIAVRVALALPYADGPRFCTLAGQVVRIDRDEQGRLRGLAVSFQEGEMAADDRTMLEGFLAKAS